MSRRDDLAGGASARYLLLGATVFLSLFGLVMIFSAASVTDVVHEGASTYHLVKQLTYIAVGLIVALLVSRFDYRRLKGSLIVPWGILVGALAATAVFGVTRNGAKRWIVIAGQQFQASEFARIMVVLIAAWLMVEWRRGKITTSQLLSRIALFVGIPAAFVVYQRDLGTTASLVIAVAIVMFLGGFPFKWIASVAGIGAALAGVMIVADPFRLGRVRAFLDPFADAQGKGYQTVQAMLAFGTGRLTGLGLGMSRQKFFYLPEAHTDFIFAIIGEEFGLIGTLAIVAAFAVFTYAGIRVALGARDKFGSLIAGGLTGMIAVQAVMNMAAVTSLMPVTGKPMPFVSYGGSSMVVTLACVGLILSVSRYGTRAPQAVRSPRPAREKPTGEGSDERRRDRRAHLPRAVRSPGSRRRA